MSFRFSPYSVFFARLPRLLTLGAFACTFAAAHDIVICKRSDTERPVSGAFEFSISGYPTAVFVPVGGCSARIVAPSLTVTVTEKITSQTELAGISADPAAALKSFDLTARTATLEVPDFAVVTVYFTNRTSTGTQGCTPGFWKNHLRAWPSQYDPDSPVSSIFGPIAGATTLIDALQGGGGPGLDGARSILLRAAVAAILNAGSGDVTYAFTTDAIIAAVRAALATGDRDTILRLAGRLDSANNGSGGCPLGGPETR